MAGVLEGNQCDIANHSVKSIEIEKECITPMPA